MYTSSTVKNVMIQFDDSSYLSYVITRMLFVYQSIFLNNALK
jgi:hypothetical protein